MTRGSRARALGWVVQGLFLGLLCFAALLQMLVMSGGAVVFRYEGF